MSIIKTNMKILANYCTLALWTCPRISTTGILTYSQVKRMPTIPTQS